MKRSREMTKFTWYTDLNKIQHTCYDYNRMVKVCINTIQQYVNEFTYRYNLRNSTTPIFSHIMQGLIKWTKTNT